MVIHTVEAVRSIVDVLMTGESFPEVSILVASAWALWNLGRGLEYDSKEERMGRIAIYVLTYGPVGWIVRYQPLDFKNLFGATIFSSVARTVLLIGYGMRRRGTATPQR